MRIAIIGSRNIHLNDELDLLEYLPSNVTEIVSGGAEGADNIAEHIADFLNVPIRIFRPDYKNFHRRAPLVRNGQIVNYADKTVALWDGASRGTAYTIDLCIKYYIPVDVLLCSEGEIKSTLPIKDLYK